MMDLAILLDDRPGALAEMGAALGRAGVSIEGGGAWVVHGRGVAHFLVADGPTFTWHGQARLLSNDSEHLPAVSATTAYGAVSRPMLCRRTESAARRAFRDGF